MVNIHVDFNKTVGRIKPMHATGYPPFLDTNYSYFHYMKDASIPYSRLHDLGTYGVKYVDIHNLFPNFSADPTDPASYRFEYTDKFIRAMYENDCAPIFRLGETIENAMRKGYGAINIDPPADYEKWAKICEMIIRHYNEGWADGHHFEIRYWEIWNEPENGIHDGAVSERNQMWTGSDEDYFRLYSVTSKHLRSCFGDSIMIGGYGASGVYAMLETPEKYGLSDADHHETNAVDRYRLKFFHGFLDYIEKENAPLDFFSFHCYRWFNYQGHFAAEIQKELARHGYGDAELHLNEWNNAFTRELRGSSVASARAAEFMISMHSSPVYMMNYYDSRLGISNYGGLFNPLTTEPFCTYFSFAAFGALYKMGNMAECVCDTEGISVIAATDGTNKGILISNTTDSDAEIKTNIESDMHVYLIDEAHHMTLAHIAPDSFILEKDQVIFIRN